MTIGAYPLILITLAAGYALGRLRVLPERATRLLNAVVLNVCLPAAILRYASRLTLASTLWAVAAVPWLLLIAAVAAVAMVSRRLKLRDDERAVLLLTVALGNTSFLGYPLVRALIGEQAMPYAVIYDQLGSFLMLSTFGLWVLARYDTGASMSAGTENPTNDIAGGRRRTPTSREMLIRILKFPPLWALIVALTLMPAEPPPPVAAALRLCSDMLMPLAMLTVGLSVRLTLPPEERRPLAVGLILKLVAMPVLALPLIWGFDLHEDAARVVVLEAAMPPMITAGALAIAHGLAPRLAAALVGFGVLLSLATLPLWARLPLG